MNTIESIAKSLKGKKVILRLDLNVPLHKQNITDTNRIDKILPTLNFLINNKSKILILSHVGRPKGRMIKDLSMEPICRYLKKKNKSEYSPDKNKYKPSYRKKFI